MELGEQRCQIIKDANSIINEKIDIVNEFNDFFVNVGSKLANEIKEQTDGIRRMNIEDTIQTNLHSMFIKEIGKVEIIDIVKKFKNKKSKDWLGIDMTIVKKYTWYCETTDIHF